MKAATQATAAEFEQGAKPIVVKHGTSVLVEGRTVALTRVRFADGVTAWVGLDSQGNQWYWRKVK